MKSKIFPCTFVEGSVKTKAKLPQLARFLSLRQGLIGITILLNVTTSPVHKKVLLAHYFHPHIPVILCMYPNGVSTTGTLRVYVPSVVRFATNTYSVLHNCIWINSTYLYVYLLPDRQTYPYVLHTHRKYW